jgi:TonB family C-terminal domain
MRVAGGIASPRKIVDVAPAYPERARASNVRGTVVVELHLGEDGSVVDTHVLRSIPALDAAAAPPCVNGSSSRSSSRMNRSRC